VKGKLNIIAYINEILWVPTSWSRLSRTSSDRSESNTVLV